MNITEYRNKRFLIVDSIKSFSETLKQMLQGRGAVKIDSASSSREATQWCKSIEYDVILMGYDLGEGRQNGQQALEELRANNLLKRSSIFILITGETSQEMVLCALEHKPDAYLTKPFSPKDLIQRLEACHKKKMAMAQVYRAMDENKHEDVIKLCDNYIENQSPYSAECLGIKSRQYFELGDFDKAMEIYQSKKDSPNCQWAVVGIGKIQFEKKDYHSAKKTFEALIKKSPLYLAAYDWLAKTCEKLNDFEQAEQVLQQAIKISPRSLRRTKQFAELCENNQNFDSATQAFKQTLKLARNSVHSSPENRLNLARALVEQANTVDNTNLAHDLQTQALGQLDTVRREYDTDEVKIASSLASARIYYDQKDSEKTHRALSLAEKIWEDSEVSIDAETKLEFAKSYAHLALDNKAEMLLEQIAAENSNDDVLLAKIDQISENPISEKGKQAAQQAIKIGINHYNNNDYDAAIREFNAAIRLYPRHVGIKLNLIQALMMSFHHDKTRVNELQRGKQFVKQLSYLATEHPHFSRYSKLKDKFFQLERKASL